MLIEALLIGESCNRTAFRIGLAPQAPPFCGLRIYAHGSGLVLTEFGNLHGGIGCLFDVKDLEVITRDTVIIVDKGLVEFRNIFGVSRVSIIKFSDNSFQRTADGSAEANIAYEELTRSDAAPLIGAHIPHPFYVDICLVAERGIFNGHVRAGRNGCVSTPKSCAHLLNVGIAEDELVRRIITH